MNRLLSLLIVCAFACSNEGGMLLPDGATTDGAIGDAGAGDAAPRDAPIQRDGGAAEDAGPIDSGSGADTSTQSDVGLDVTAMDAGATMDAGSLDPASCTPGPADGCCPLLARGGSDPDCPSLRCNLHLSGGILLEERPLRTRILEERRGAVPMVWTGHELVLARTGAGSTDEERAQIILERRDAAGAQRSIEFQDIAARSPGIGAAALALRPSDGALWFGHSATMRSAWLYGVRSGAAPTREGHVGDACSDIRTNMGLHASDIGLRAYYGNTPCTPGRSAGLTTFFDVPMPGVEAHVELTRAYGPSFACGNGCDEGLFAFDDSGVVIAHHDFLTGTRRELLRTGVVPRGVRSTALAFNGAGYLAVIGYSQADSVRYESRLVGEDGSVGPPVQVGVEAQTFIPPKLIWTGDGYVMATVQTHPAGDDANDREDHRVAIWQLDLSGALVGRHTFDYPSTLPSIAWAGGRIAVTAVYTADEFGVRLRRAEDRYLHYLECAE